ncbi:unnamed protein product [Lathyrus sativus]|nr:unnamed protein product [Lathyrus sativus]
MSLCSKIAPHFNSTPLSHHQFLLQRFNGFSQRKCGTFFMHNHLPEMNNNPYLSLTFHTRLCSSNTNGNTYELSDSSSHEGTCIEIELLNYTDNGNNNREVRYIEVIRITLDNCKIFLGSEESKESKKGESLSINEIMKKLKRYGVSGILSYGLLNTAYYLTTFLFVWFYVVPAPAKMGYRPAVERFLKLLAMVWAGSQVTKLLRAAGALALAPFVDRGLTWFTNKFKFQSQGKVT